MTSPKAYDILLAEVHELHDLGKAAAVLSWDREVNMPPQGEAARVEQMTTLRRLIHQRSVSDAALERLEAAAESLGDADPEGDPACLVRVLRRDVAQARRLPEAFVVESSQVGAKAWQVWRAAREAEALASAVWRRSCAAAAVDQLAAEPRDFPVAARVARCNADAFAVRRTTSGAARGCGPVHGAARARRDGAG